MCVKCNLSFLFASLKPCFPLGFRLLLHLMSHFWGRTLICTDSYDACSLSAIHFIQSMLHGAVLTSISSPSPISHFPPFSLYFLSLSFSLPLLFSLSPSFSIPLFLLLYLFSYYSPTPPPCLSAAAPPRLTAKQGPPPPSPQLPRNKRGESDPYIHPCLHHPIAAPVPLFGSISFCCCSAFSTCPRPATHGERRAGEAVAATTSPSPSPRLTTWPCPISCVDSASLSSWWGTPARWR